MKPPAMLLVVAAAIAFGQAGADQNRHMTAREWYYTPPEAAAAPPPNPGSMPPLALENKQAPTPQESRSKFAARLSDRRTTRRAATANAPAEQEAKAQLEAKTNPEKSITVAPVPQSLAPLGLRYVVMRRNAGGQYDEVDGETMFHSGDRIRLQVESNSDGYLYVVTQGSSGNWQLLFPTQDVANGSNRIQRSEGRQIPSGNGQFVFDDNAGTEKLFVVMSRQPEKDLDKLIYQISAPSKESAQMLMAQAGVSNDVVERLRQMNSRDLIFEKVEAAQKPSDGRIETAAYVVNPSNAPDARLVVDLTLHHK